MKKITSLLLLLLPVMLVSQATPDINSTELDTYFRKMVADWDIPPVPPSAS